MMKVSDYVFDFLKKKGTEQVFMLPGGGAMHLVDSLGKSGINYICFQHEQGAAIAGEAYGQHTNKPGVVLTTSGPGATNAITGVTAGYIDSTPMFIISGQAKRKDLVGDRGVRQTGSQEVPIIDMVRPITKYAVEIMEPSEIRYHLERAYYEAVSKRPGPVWLSIPLDVQGATIDENNLEGFVEEDEQKPEDFEEKTEKIIECIYKAKKPVALAGNGIKLSGATDEFYNFIEKLNIPVLTTWKTIDMFDENHRLYIGHPGIMGDRAANKLLQEADLLISVGSRIDTSLSAFDEANFAKNAKKIIIDVDENEIKRMNMEKEVSMAWDAKQVLVSLNEKIKGACDTKEWIEHCHSLRKKYPVVTEKHRNTGDFVSAYYFIEKLCENLKSDDVIVPESSGAAGEITYQAFKIKKGQKMKNAAGLGSMGFGLPYAIGSCVANDRRRTILINGDGAFQLNIQELETLHRLKLPVKIFIWDNSGYASIRSMQRGNFNGHYVASSEDSGFSVPDCTKVAEAYGFKTCIIKNNEELDKKLGEILGDNEPVLCQLKVSPDETVWPRVKAKVLPDGGMKSGALEDMWPYEQ